MGKNHEVMLRNALSAFRYLDLQQRLAIGEYAAVHIAELHSTWVLGFGVLI